MDKINADIWTTVHWWGWKIHVNQAGLDLLNDKLITLNHWLKSPPRKSYVTNPNGCWPIIITWFIFIILTKVVNFKFKTCNTHHKQKWCENILECNDKCQPIKIKEITISFLWLPFLFIPVKKRIIK